MISVSSWVTTDPTFSPSSTEVTLAAPGLIPPPAHYDDPGHALGMITTAGTVIGYWVDTTDYNHIFGTVTARTASGKVMNRLEDSPCLKATVSPDLVAELNGSDRTPSKLAPSLLGQFYEHRRNLEGLRRATTGYWQQWLTELTAEGLTPTQALFELSLLQGSYGDHFDNWATTHHASSYHTPEVLVSSQTIHHR